MIEATYGITPAEYQALYTAQGGVCAICQRATGKTRRLAVDHNHQTGEVRGLLCKTCNWIVIGRYSITMLSRAIDYLINPPARTILQKPAPTETVWVEWNDGFGANSERPIK
ncbi:endonuclease VII domain-containing protein [Mycobacteroides abscessus]|uniref:endonuclease VII domain-containing protein n=1 Tax=Mycobacteroides abscessus TaxID=36809 RepID=UPI000925F404|nr:endonuclease VII domain-containing protein [Mycobacteroides abscessus]SHU54419.1 recombination endonuclease VII [Mycobacteroides abscessus subsp. bolletii]